MSRSANRLVPAPEPVAISLQEVSAGSENMSHNVPECPTFEHFRLSSFTAPKFKNLALAALPAPRARLVEPLPGLVTLHNCPYDCQTLDHARRRPVKSLFSLNIEALP